ncbi:MAG: hypothetical protein FWJ74_12305, partial [Gemmatimonadota bacterium]
GPDREIRRALEPRGEPAARVQTDPPLRSRGGVATLPERGMGAARHGGDRSGRMMRLPSPREP